MALKASGEMYLETIYILRQKQSSVRSVDIAEYMNFSKPSVSRAVGILKNEDYIAVDGEGYITLTEKGEQIAGNIYQRHTVLSKVFMMLGVDEETATQDACKIEHVISEKSFQAIKEHVEKSNIKTD